MKNIADIESMIEKAIVEFKMADKKERSKWANRLNYYREMKLLLESYANYDGLQAYLECTLKGLLEQKAKHEAVLARMDERYPNTQNTGMKNVYKKENGYNAIIMQINNLKFLLS